MFRESAGANPDGLEQIAPLANHIPVVKTAVVSNLGNATASPVGTENSATEREMKLPQCRHLYYRIEFKELMAMPSSHLNLFKVKTGSSFLI